MKVLCRSSTKRMALRNTRLALFETMHGQEDAKARQDQVKRLGAMLSQRDSEARWVIHPEKNDCIGRWDIITSMALLYTAILTPFEVGFLEGCTGNVCFTDPWFYINRVLDVIFFVDMCLQFFVAFQSGNALGGYTWVLDQRHIVRHYLRTWFALDAATVFFPAGFDLYVASLGSDADNVDKGASRGSALRVLRALRIVKLVRLVRASRLYTAPGLT